jgi:hypothetical protein
LAQPGFLRDVVGADSSLRDVLTLLPAWDRTKVLSLAPAHWRETRQQAQTRQLLDSRQVLGRSAVHEDEDDAAR